MTDERRLSTSDIAAADRHETDVAERDRTDQLRNEEERRAGAARSERPDQHGWTDAPTPLFADDELGGYRARWSAIQTGFVDEPRKAVEEADTLVAEVMKRLAEVFSEQRQRLEADWDRNDKISTEDLRQSMRRYRSFFERLLTI
jgi:hypothetical protein